MNEKQTPQIAPELIWRLLDDNAVVVSPQGGKVRVLNGVGTEIWKMLADQQSRQVIQDHIVSQFNVSGEQATADMDFFFRDLTDKGLLVWSR